jgi:hypothetical protein
VVRERAEAARQQEHDQRDRDEGQARGHGRIAGDLLEVDGDEERRRAEPGVDEQRRDVADREVARAEEAERQHRVGRAALVANEGDEQRGAAQAGHVHDRVPEAMRRLLDQREHGPGEAEPDEQRAEGVDALRGRHADGLGHRRAQERERREDERHVDGEDPAPRREVDQQAAPERPDHRRDPGPRRPRPDRRAALLGRERRADDGQRGGDEQRARDPLQRARRHQQLRGRRERAQHRGDAEPRQPDGEDQPPAEQVAERAADQQQRAERQEVGLDDPLLRGEASFEVVADRRQRHVDYRAVGEDDHRGEDAGDQREALRACIDHRL